MVATLPVADTTVAALRDRLRGPLLEPGDAGYDAARTIWNAMIDRRPALIARCTGAADVIAAVQFAREHDLPVSVRGGGHNVAGTALVQDGLTIDLSLMKGIRVDPEARTARAEPGVLWEELDKETQAFGLATVGGTVGTTGIAGLTLGGGFGWLSDKYGLAVDNLLSADVVTADGRLLRASETENTDLFWALRGGGGNFGVVTSFEYRLHPVGPIILGGMLLHPLAEAREVLRFYRAFMADKPDELSVYAAILTGPDGVQVASLALCYAGDPAEGERVVAPLRAFGAPIADLVGPMPYLAQQELLGVGFPYGRQHYWKSGQARELTDGVIESVVEHAARVPSPFTAVVIAGNNGVCARVGKTSTAYYHRDASYNVMILSGWEGAADTERNIAWTRGLYAALEPELSGGVYVNDMMADEGEARIRAAYGENYARLAAIKAIYDPTNFFRSNQNIKPML